MAYNTQQIKRDQQNAPIPQYFNPNTDTYEPLYGANGAARYILYDADGNPVDLETLITDIKAQLLAGVRIAGNETLFQGNLTLTGTAQQLPSQASKVVTIQAEPSNRGYVYIGLSNVSADNHMSTLAPGSSMTFYVSNLNLLYVYGAAGDKICWGGEV